ncbi:unnamed protein product [Orchesella dallaii]|uniref:Uncharacterized protein n=1 Tax=Orchesella dallaii TaxID=48710 RepID=A0ABP1QRW4_9HEXA
MFRFYSIKSHFKWRHLLLTVLLTVMMPCHESAPPMTTPTSLENEPPKQNVSGVPKPRKPKDFTKLELNVLELAGSRWAIEQDSVIEVAHAIEIVDATLVHLSQLSLKVEFHLRQTWVADGLQFPPGLFKDDDPPNVFISADENVLKRMWSPDSYVATSRESNMNVAQAPQSLVYIYPNRTIIFRVRMFTKVGCSSSFQWYPLDSQICDLIIESYKYHDDVVSYQWTDARLYRPVEVYIKRLLQYDLRRPLYYDNGTTRRGGRGVKFPFVRVRFTFDRRLGNNMIQVFTPTTLVVVLSWFSFWLGLDAIPGRISLLVTCMLTLVTMHSGLKSSIPPVHYVTMMDIWFIACMAFVFSAICEFVVVKYLDWRHQLQQKVKEKRFQMSNENYETLINIIQDRIGSPEDKLSYRNAATNMKDVPLTIPRQFSWGNIAPQQVVPEEMVKPVIVGAANPIGIRDNEKGIRNRVRISSPQEDGKLVPENVAKPKRHLWVLFDRLSRAIFPLLFLIFNCVYWPVLFEGSAVYLNNE